MKYAFGIVVAVVALVTGYTVSWMITPIIIGITYAIAALGVSVMMRAGQVSFGHAIYACISAYTVAFLARAYPELDSIVLIVAGVFAACVASMVIGVFVARYRDIFFGMLNLALSMVLFALLSKLYHITGGTDGLRIDRPTILGMELERVPYEFTLLVITLVVAFGLALWIQRYFHSGDGEALAAIKTNETRLEYLGFSAYSIMWRGYVISAAVVGFSGALLALIQGLVTPEIGLWLRSAEYVFIAILGGAGHVIGAFLGALVFEAVKLLSTAYFPGLWQFILGFTLIIVIFVFPKGIVGQLSRLFKSSREA